MVLKGRWGAFIKAGKKNVRIPKGTEPSSLKYEDVMKLVNGESLDKSKAVVVKKTAKKAASSKSAPKKSVAKTTKTKASAKKTSKAAKATKKKR